MPAKPRTKIQPPDPATARLMAEMDVLAPHPVNPRQDLGDLRTLTDSIGSQGVLQPLVVAPWPNGTTEAPEGVSYVILAGHRRYAAATAAGLTEVPITVLPLTTVAEQVAVMLAENINRADLTVVEEARGIQTLLDLSWTQTQIHQQTGIPKSTISTRARIAKLPEGTQSKISAGQVTLEHALVLVEFANDPDALSVLEPITNSWELERTATVIRNRREDAKREAARRRELVKQIGGVTYADFETSAWLVNGASDDDLDDACYDHIQDASELTMPDQLQAEDDREYTLALHTATGCKGLRIITDGPRDGQLVCTTPDQHPAPRDEEDEDTPTSATDPDGAAAEQAAEEHRQALAAAAEVRASHYRRSVVPLIGPQHRDVATAARLQLTSCLAYAGPDAVRPFLAPQSKATSTGGLVSDATDADVVAFAAIRPDDADRALRFNYQYGNHPAIAQAWVALLEGTGYELSDLERSLLPEPPAASDDAADDDQGSAEEDDDEGLDDE